MTDETETTDETVWLVRKTMMVFAAAIIILGFFNSANLTKSMRDLPANALTDRLVLASISWHEKMEAAGFAAVVPAIRDGFMTFRKMKWHD